MFDFISGHAGAMALTTVVLVTAAVLAARWDSLGLWLLSVWYSLPLVGGIAWLARRESSRQALSHANSPAVLTLCSSYARFIRVLSRAEYDNYMNYLRKAGDLGRQPFPPYLRVVIFLMILVEAAGLAYVLAGWTLPGASEFAQRIAALGIGFLIAVVLVFFTHWAGLELDQTNRYRRDLKEWIAAGRRGPLFGPDLSLNDAQDVDDDEPAFRQRATRGHGKTSYVLTAITLIMVIAVGSGAAYVRGQVIEQEILMEASSRSAALQRFALSARDVANTQPLATDQQLIQQEVSIKRRGAWGTLIILGTIFFFLQLLSIFFGYRHSFNGRLSKDAYRALKADRFSSYGELLLYYDRIADIAQSKLQRLQQLLERNSGHLLDSPLQGYSFRDYLQAREAQRRRKPLGMEADASQPPSVQRPATLPAESAPAAPATSNGATVPSAHSNAPAQPPVRPEPPRSPPLTYPATAQWPDFDLLSPNGSSEGSLLSAQDESYGPIHNAELLLGPDAGQPEQSELAERAGRERSSQRSARARVGSKRRTSARSESGPD
jgi:hypothetical protein